MANHFILIYCDVGEDQNKILKVYPNPLKNLKPGDKVIFCFNVEATVHISSEKEETSKALTDTSSFTKKAGDSHYIDINKDTPAGSYSYSVSSPECQAVTTVDVSPEMIVD